MAITIIVIELIVTVFAVFEDYLGKQKNALYWGVGVLLIAVAGFKNVDSVRDAANYEYFFINNDDPILAKGVEFSFLWLSKLLYPVFHDVHAIFLLYAAIAIPVKLYAIKRISPICFLPLVIYISNYYILHDLTQIRASVASGFFIVSVYYLGENKKNIAFLLMICAAFFHYSAISLFPLLFLSNKDLNTKGEIIWAALIPMGYLLYFLHINIIATVPIPYISGKIEVYQELTEKGIGGYDQINVFNLVFLVNILIFYYNLFFYETIKANCPTASLVLKIQAISIFFLPALANIPAIAFRVYELFGVINIIAFQNVYYTIKQNVVAKCVVASIGWAILCVNLFYSHILES